MNMNPSEIRYMTPREIVEDPTFCFTLPMLRYYLLNRHKNGLSSAIRKIGKKLLIRRDLFIDWIEKQAKNGSANAK